MARKIIRLPRTKEQKQANREQNQRANRTILRRTLVLMVLCGIVAFVPLIGTLYHLMITEHDYYNEKAIKNQTRSTNLTATRGVIYDANMNVLASSSTVETVFIDPNEIAEQMKQPENSNLLDQIARGLGEILDVEPSFVYEQAADKQYRYKVIKRKISEELADEVRAFISENSITGVYLETDLKRYYPNSSLAAQALGFVSSDNNGSEGLEAYYNEELSGTAGKVVTSKGNYGSEMLYTYEKYYDASDGSSLITTIDSTVQAYVEKNLQNAIDKYDIKNGAFCIVMDVNTGEIKAMATLGSYDPNNYLEIYDDTTALLLENERAAALALPEASAAYEAAIETYKQDVAAARMAQWRNRCVSDGYEPGSTFKLITLASALDSGAVTLNDSFYCGGQEKFTGREQILNCWKSAGHGAQTTAQALGNSCNIAFGHIGLRMGGDTFYDYLKSFGVMEKTGVDLPGEASGLFYERKYLNDPANYGTSYLITSSFGQSFRITPMQLVRAVAAIVNGGYVLEPYIVSEVVDADGNTVEKNEKTVLRQVISQQTSETMRTLMEQVVTEGTASAAQTPGYRVGGKTGTSEKLDEYDENGQQVKDKIVSFVGVAPIDDPKYVVLVALDTPAYSENSEKYTVHGMYISGGLMAAPTVRDIFLDILPYLGVEPDYGSEDIRGVNFTVPDVIGMDETEAGELLAEKTITYRVVGTGSVVTDQLPVAGSQVPGNSQIILYMGAEKQATRVEVPDFIGCSVADVNYLASNAGLYVQAKGTDRTDVYVLAAYQDIDPGTEVDRGTTITVEFSSTGASD
ncbi:MAG: penicillin-binding transpeptidase domain-containing protein [Oscillospiraceae bacterium]|nr:PASTA domain-containing protein [Clostridiales bacterium]MCI7134435.1 PASTA domain-containing protein [Clostridiales bacterium]MDD7250306.1 penicillin-binding transpeptidase domain-containing protein [Clostridiales bacterium]MDY2718448.1 penicillin-binding transpeptidase domain-containing protein [Oscillospiraceae bacterium]MDY4995491.1 penicillin-binding transpeptidase domain-containing protein [Oscillospiraceae bacterium]